MSNPSNSCHNVEKIIRPNILKLKPYRCARDDYSEGILLDANENSFGSPLDSTALSRRDAHLERYPCPYQMEFKTIFSQWRNVSPEQIFLGVGSDEAIDLLIRITCIPRNDSIIVTPPTYGMYSVAANINDVEIISCPLTPEFQIVTNEILNAVKSHTKLIFLCSPGNPTSRLLRKEDIIALLKSSYRGLVVVDEAYIDFAEGSSICKLVNQYSNLVVLQTLSKGFGLAGIRLGMAIGNKTLIQIMNNVKAPYNINKLTSQVAVEAFQNLDVFNNNIQKVLKEKERVIEALSLIPEVRKVHHSDTNFILFEIVNSYEIYKLMAELGVVLRYRGNLLHCDSCLRTTIGTKSENDTMLTILKQVINQIH